jgi:glycerol-3-phosphate dehydrogenase
MADFDLAIIGGGINGAGIARDAAGRGLKVVLLEQSDLASGTSSASSKLIHGGLRYLEHGALRLVRAALSEREVLLRMAPHLIRPLRFVLPLDTRYRSPAVLRLGLFIYDMIGRREILPGTRSVDLAIDATGVPLRQHFHRGYEYSDCFADDARLVVLNAVDAAERGAVIRTRTRCARAERGDTWRLILNARVRGWIRSPRWSCGKSRPAACGSTKAATSSCRGSTITTAPIFCRRPTAGSCLPFPFSAISP